jgi:hypothetical protein
MTWLNIFGSISSVLGLGVSLYVLVRELRLQDDVTELKSEEEQWHSENTSQGRFFRN